MNKLLFLVFLGLSIFLISCDDPTPSDPCDKCTDQQTCKANRCYAKACSAEYPNGACAKNQHCDAGECIVELCSAEYPKGVCEEDQTCNNGVCQAYDCSRSHPNGVCPNGEVCLPGGACGVATCTPDNPNGTCENGSECSSSGQCIEIPCNAENPNGACEDGFECVSGECLNEDRCSPTNPSGVCGLNERCSSEGVCEGVVCNDSNPDGACPDGEFCDRILSSGEYHFECKSVPTTCTNTDNCPKGYRCVGETCVEDSCDITCQEKEYCYIDKCLPDPFFCGAACDDGPECWCEEGLLCINGDCSVPVYNPCTGVNCDAGQTCIVTNWEEGQNGYECINEIDKCSDANFNGRCDSPLVCKAGLCTNDDPCKNITCSEDGSKVCDRNQSNNGVCTNNLCCVDSFCFSNPNICTEEHTVCVNSFGGDKTHTCLCEDGYQYSLTEGKCVLHITACTGKDCGEGVCEEDDWGQEGWSCNCTTGMEYLDPSTKHLCIDPATYNFCTGWDCGVGHCEEITASTGEREPVCVCPQNYIFDSLQNTCVPGIECGNQICNNPLKEKCINNQFCEAQPCNSNYPEGTCGDSETCISGSCVLTEECSSSTSSGYCMDGYSCKTGICCKGGNCTTTDGTLKAVGETCNVETNNCVNDATCIATPTGDGVCHKLCDQTQVDTCSSLNVGDTIYHCIGRDVFNDVNYERIGVCAVDNNCDKFSNEGCNTNQVCLAFRRTSFSQCYAFEDDKPLGSTCTTGQTTQGFNVACDENLLCVDDVCVPNCDNKHKITDYDVNLCYAPFEGNYKVENLKVKDQGDLLFTSSTKHTDISTCDPNGVNSCSGASCIKIQEKDPLVAASKDLGFCSESCDFNSSNYKAECGGTNICFSIDSVSLCLGDSSCDVTSSSSDCAGDEVCYPVTSTLSSCMSTMGMGHVGEECTGACQYGMCIDGTCQYPCSIGDDSSCLDNRSCQSTTDSYINNASHFDNPSVYGTCQ